MFISFRHRRALGKDTDNNLNVKIKSINVEYNVMQSLTIGELSKKTGTTSVAIRHYERCGLIRNVIRKPSGYRLYPEAAIRQIHFIKNSQSVGFSLEEIKELIDLQEQSGTTSQQIKVLIRDKLNVLQEKEKTVRTMVKILKQLEASCDGKRPLSQCPILESLHAPKRINQPFSLLP